MHMLRKFARDDSGAALIEYTVLLAILVVALIVTITAVGSWVNGKWATLNTQLQAIPS